MKKLLLASAILAVSLLNAQRQVPQGTAFVTGQIAYSHQTDDATARELSNLRLMPTAGYFFAPNWAVALGVGYKSETDKVTAPMGYSKTETSAFLITPSLRRFWVLDERFSLFGQLDIPLEFGSRERTIGNLPHNSASYTGWGISLKPGIDYFLSKRWKIAATVGELAYYGSKTNGAPEEKNTYNAGLNFTSAGFGLKYMFPAKQ
ncbi:MAG: porin family protein [Chryseobacterium sp.]|nr:MAG: porin family protein [Chryseobacterium sp.]